MHWSWSAGRCTAQGGEALDVGGRSDTRAPAGGDREKGRWDRPAIGLAGPSGEKKGRGKSVLG